MFSKILEKIKLAITSRYLKKLIRALTQAASGALIALAASKGLDVSPDDVSQFFALFEKLAEPVLVFVLSLVWSYLDKK